MPPGYKACVRPNFGAFFADLLILNRAEPHALRRYVAGRAGEARAPESPRAFPAFHEK